MPDIEKQHRRKRGLIVQREFGSLELAPGERYQPSKREVDLCFVFDTTGSMSDKIDGLTSCMVDFVRELDTLNLAWRVSVVPFGDLTIPGDTIIATNAFVEETGAAVSQLRQMPRNSGGGNRGESSIEAMEAAVGKPYRPHAVKIVTLLTDEPALGAAANGVRMLQHLRDREFITFVVSPDKLYFRTWASETGGKWFPISSAVDTAAILSLLRQLATDLALVAYRVHALAGGSVRRYLERGNDSERGPSLQ